MKLNITVKLRAAYPFGRLREMNPLRSRGAGRTWLAKLRSTRRRGASCGLRYGIGGRLKIDRLARCFGALVLEHAGIPQHDVYRASRERNLEISDVVAIGPKESADNPGGRFWRRHRCPRVCQNRLRCDAFLAAPAGTVLIGL